MIALFTRVALILASAILLTLLLTWLFVDGSPSETARVLLRGHVEGIAKELAATPPVERNDKAASLEEQLGYGVSLEEARGEGGTRTEKRAGSLYVVARVPGNPGQVALGPLPFGYATSLRVVTVAGLFVVCVLALLVSLVVTRRIRGLEEVAARMHAGDFSARAERDESDVLDGIGSSLNRLADRVGELLHDERDLLRTVAHEVRTPISRMHFRVESISRKAQSDSPKEAAGLVSDLEQVDKLFAELLTYVGFDEFHQDRPELQTSVIDVAESVSRVAKEVTSTNEGVEVEIRADDDARVVANAKLFDRATSNLVLNAMAYGGEKIFIDIRVFENECVVDVQDTGPGIPEDDRPKVIKPFVRLAKKKTKGTGLGLAIVSRIMRLHGGQLHIVDGPKGGASVQLAWQNAKPHRKSRRGFGRDPGLK